ncbi:TolB family protein [Aureispira anguillae]|uniref:DUF5050 domain-containing protein n=1 Tax=Aureispira anguillae TaxID=2864201 RepID=A0A916DRT0_9BACT|nr:DUF5050 domain-containing protein [Aureispira anguillae]BDS11451.1 DUF5050 domain-containing protein [Aureispira anguillae]
MQTKKTNNLLILLCISLFWIGCKKDLPPNNTNEILFEAHDGNYYQIFKTNADGSNETQLTSSNIAYSSMPSWAPDGSKIFFISNKDESNGEIYSMNTDGSNVLRLTNNSRPERFPSLSADGTKILFEAIDNNYYQLFTINADGSNETQLTSSNIAYSSTPSWAPDGSKIFFISDKDESNGEIYSMNTDGSNVLRLTNNSRPERFPSLSADGTKILFEAIDNNYYQLFTINAGGSNETQLTNSNIAYSSTPSWAPDGSKIFFISNKDESNGEIYSMNTDGSNVLRLTNNSRVELFPSSK